jgi:calcineurin-like phosphoesterase family protein
LNGKKKLIMGNHDIYEIKDYQQYFYDIKAYRVFDKFIFSHIPVHKSSIGRFRGNAHGHLHSGQVMLDNEEIEDLKRVV